jgi:hypothetical protein
LQRLGLALPEVLVVVTLQARLLLQLLELFRGLRLQGYISFPLFASVEEAAAGLLLLVETVGLVEG